MQNVYFLGVILQKEKLEFTLYSFGGKQKSLFYNLKVLFAYITTLRKNIK